MYKSNVLYFSYNPYTAYVKVAKQTSLIMVGVAVNTTRLGKNVEYESKLRAVGLHIDPYELPRNKWSGNIDTWQEIAYPDMYTYLISTPGNVR